MPLYPGYDKESRAKYAREMKAIFDFFSVDPKTESGKHISDWATDGNWLDKAIAYFKPSHEEHTANPRLFAAKVSISSKLEMIRDIKEKTSAYADGKLPEEGAEEWNRLMYKAEQVKDLNSAILSFNELTENKKISDPAVLAALNMGRCMSVMNAQLEQFGSDSLLKESRSFPDESIAIKRDILRQTDEALERGRKANVNAYDIMGSLTFIIDKMQQLETKRAEYEKMAEALDKASSKDVRNLDAAGAKIQVTQMELAYQQYRLFGTMANNKERELNKMQTDLAMDHVAGEDNPELEKDVKDREEELSNLRKLHDLKKAEHQKLRAQFDQLPEKIKAPFNTDFNFNIKQAEERIDTLSKQLDSQKEELASSDLEAAKLRESGKALSEKLRQMSEQIKEKHNELDNKFFIPVADVSLAMQNAGSRMNEMKDKKGRLLADLNILSTKDPRPGAREKMKNFLEQLEKNKRPLHRDSAEFKALKDVVKRYSEGDGTVFLKDVRKAANDYLGKKEGQRMNANSTMRNYRKAIAGMIVDYTTAISAQLAFHHANAKEMENLTKELNTIDNDVDGRTTDAYKNMPLAAERLAVEDAFKADVNKSTKPMIDSIKQMDQQVLQHIALKEKLVQEAKAPEAAENKVQRQLNEPVKKKAAVKQLP